MTKDLATSFLTLLTAVLVASLTFSDKIVDLKTAHVLSRLLMLACWLCVLGAILSCGVGLAFMTLATGWAAYSPLRDCRIFEDKAVRLFVGAGITFGCGLAALLTAGAISLFEHKPALDESNAR